MGAKRPRRRVHFGQSSAAHPTKLFGCARLEAPAIYLDVNGEEERSSAERLW